MSSLKRRGRSLSALVVAAVLLAPPAEVAAVDTYRPNVPVAVTGLFVVGQELDISLPVDADLSVEVEWLADGVPLAGESGTRLELTAAHAGKAISANVVLDTPNAQAVELSVEPDATVLDIPFTSYSSFTIDDGVDVSEPACRAPSPSGPPTPAVGWNVFFFCQAYNTSLGAPSEWKNSWALDGEWLPGITRSSINLKPEYAGATLAGALTAKWPNGAVFIEVKQLPGLVPQRVVAAKPQISGQVAAGATLTALTDGFDPAAALTYQWYSDFLPLAGQSAKTLSLTPDWAETRIQVLVTATRAGQTTSSRISDPVGSVEPSVAESAYEAIFTGYSSTDTVYDINYFTSPGIPPSLLTKRKAELQKAADFWADVFLPASADVMYFTQNDTQWAQDWFANRHPNVSVNIDQQMAAYGCPYAVASRFASYIFYQCAHTDRLDGVEDHQVTPHEYTHWVQYSRTSSNWLPATRWLIEGQANFYGLALGMAQDDEDLELVNRQLAGQSLSFDNYVGAGWSELVMLKMLKSGDITDVSTLLARSGSARDSYVIGSLLSEWLVLKFGHDKYWQWVSGILDGKEATQDYGAALTAELTEGIFGIKWSDFAMAAIPYMSMRAAELEQEWIDVITPDMPPAAPSEVHAIPGDGAAAVSWSQPADNGSPILGYRVRWEDYSLNCPSSPCTVSDLANGREYEFRVVAYSEHGDSQESAPSNRVRPRGRPGAPVITSLVAGDRRVRLEWQAPDANGSDLLGYRVEWTGGSKECPSSPCSVTGLVNGLAYTFRVLALSSSGDSPLSMPSMLAFPAGPPKAATKAWVKPTAAKKAAISWAGASGNGVRILRYEVSWKAAAAKSFGPWKSAGGKTTFVMTGLSKGKKYQARVRVVTAKGVAISKTIAFTQTK